MARGKQQPNPNEPDWISTMLLFQSGSPEFVDALRQHLDADRLGAFAATWFSDQRPVAREFLFAYLDRPLNSPRHEALVKRLFKLAERAGDDAVMARFLAALDRAIRRRRGTVSRWNHQTRSIESVDRVAMPPDTTLPRKDQLFSSDWFQKSSEKFLRGKFLFSVPTRQYLRRRAWRYFRKLGKQSPDRYIAAVTAAVRLYSDADMPDGVSLLDNWGLCHILFHFSPTLVARPRGWAIAAGGSLAQLQPDPIYRKLWQKSAEPIFDLLVGAKARTVALWAMKMLRRHFPERFARVPVVELLRWLISENTVLNDLAVELLERAGGLEKVPVAEWLAVLDTARLEVIDRICEMMLRVVKPEQVSFADAVRLAMQRPIPLAHMGRAFLAGKSPATDDEIRVVFALREAEAEPIRPDLVKWACTVLSAHAGFQPMWVLEFLDARYEDVRAIGWEWLQTDIRARDETAVWQRLIESPHDDIRLRLVRMLEERAAEQNGLAKLSSERVRFLWACVLLNVNRGSRAKPYVIRQMVSRLAAHPDEAGELLPIVAVALRSVRGPEFRAGLSGVAAFVANDPARRELVQAVFPELSWK